MSEIKLLPCPFCGGETKVSNLGFNQYLISCKDCWAETIPTTGLENTIIKWNTRKPMQEIVERLEEMKPDIECFEDEEDYPYALKRHNKYIEIVKEVGGMNE